ncbi:MAG TPA: aminoglycoside phosphotransferase family protein [Devosia sp.]|nr:aminoglycoside phosphotransferase family protein [Devosia sp.]
MSDPAPDLETRARALVEDLGLGRAADVRCVRPLTGGVASDIAVVELEDRSVCIKFALPKLRVAADWRAPVHRNRAEYRWLEFAGTVVPDAVPRLFGWSATHNGFAMEYLSGPEIYLWKTAMLAEQAPRDEARQVGAVLGRIHAASAAPGFYAGRFQNRDDFRALRIEPYLLFTASKHADLAPAIEALAAGLYASQTALVHGDVSPKNILLRAQGPVLLDAECATMGDPAFDVAFCLNHLVLKSIHMPHMRTMLLRAIGQLWASYSPLVNWEPPSALEARVTALLPALMLARVDGKSPVEYLTADGKAVAREQGRRLFLERQPTIASFVESLRRGLAAE